MTYHLETCEFFKKTAQDCSIDIKYIYISLCNKISAIKTVSYIVLMNCDLTPYI